MRMDFGNKFTIFKEQEHLLPTACEYFYHLPKLKIKALKLSVIKKICIKTKI